jgi:hypothetical protein
MKERKPESRHLTTCLRYAADFCNARWIAGQNLPFADMIDQPI